MSLEVRDSRSRGRSRSPSGRDRDRSRSRDSRVPSPPEDNKRKKKSSKKYYDDELEQDDAKVQFVEAAPGNNKQSRKYYDSSDSDDRRQRSSGKYRDEDDRNSKSRKYYEEELQEEEDNYRRKLLYDDELDDRQKHSSSKKSSSKKIYDSDSDSDADDRKYAAIKPTKSSAPPGAFSNEPSRKYEAHPSYAQPEPYEYGRPDEYIGAKHVKYMSTQPDDWAEIPEYERPDFIPPDRRQAKKVDYASPTSARSSDKNLPLNGSGVPYGSIGGQLASGPGYGAPTPPYQGEPVYPGQKEPYDQGSNHSFDPRTDVSDSHRARSYSGTPGGYASPEQYQYAQVDPNIKYSKKSERKYTQSGDPQFDKHSTKSYTQSAHPQFVEIRPGGKQEARLPDKGLSSGMDRLSVGGKAGGLSLSTAGLAGQSRSGDAKPPGSPLLEAYHGTYQSISPMPSPVMGAHKFDSNLSDLELDRSSDDSRRGSKKKHTKEVKPSKHDKNDRRDKQDPRVTVISPATPKSAKRVSFYDPSNDAKLLASALSARTVDPGPLIRILPHLSDDDIMALRSEYKNHAKMGGKGINIAKHIKLKVPGNLGKAAYATALGRWESEAYWANCWYQGGLTRRELLIESLMGRSNSDIREIKAAFSDKRYSDSLERCMKAELKADKFRTAILLALEERRQPESRPLSLDHVRDDIRELHRALTSKEGGETAMINIIVVRSDRHLKEVLRGYEATYRRNFAKEMIAKSRNLVGETLAHILNGALNRPMRDALLLHQAIAESTGKDRAELLISRAIRLHWEPRHMDRVLEEYHRRYGIEVDEAIERTMGSAGKKGLDNDWGDYLVEIVGGEQSGMGR